MSLKYQQFDAGIDRLSELRDASGTVVDDNNINHRASAFSIDVNASISSHMKQYDLITQAIEHIVGNTDKVQQLQVKNKTIANERQRREIMNKLDAIMGNTSEQATFIKKTFDSIKNENKEFELENNNSTELTMRNNLYTTNIRKFHTIMNKYNQQAQEFKSDLQKRTIRELRIIDANLTDEQINSIVESGKANEVIAAALIDGDLQNTVKAIEARHNEIMKLEQQVLEIFELFKDLQNIVDLQQESLDVIDNNVYKAFEQTTHAEKELTTASDYTGKIRRRKCLIITIILIALAVFLIPIIVTQVHKNK